MKIVAEETNNLVDLLVYFCVLVSDNSLVPSKTSQTLGIKGVYSTNGQRDEKICRGKGPFI